MVEKLGVRPGSAVELGNLAGERWFVDLLREAGADLEARPPFDLVFVHVADAGELDQLARLREQIKPAGAVWVVRAKGTSRRVGDVDIIEAAMRHRLVDNKIASFSETLSAMRLVIPLKLR